MEIRVAFKTVIDCTNDVNIRHFLQSDRCANIRLHPIFVDDIRYLDKYLSETDPIAIILSTSILSIADMYNLITSQFSQRRYILCVGQIKTKKDKAHIKVLQDEYNCSIIENVVTDLVLMNHIIDCIVENGGVEFIGTNAFHESGYTSETTSILYAETEDYPAEQSHSDQPFEKLAEESFDVQFDDHCNKPKSAVSVPSGGVASADDEDDVSFD